jgi:hypothetical protein
MPTKGTQLIDHIGLSVVDLARSKAFYLKALAPLDIAVVMEIPASVTGDFDAGGKAVILASERRGNVAEAPHRLHGRLAVGRRCLLLGRDLGGWRRQRRARIAAALSQQLLRRLCPRSRWAQYRGGMPPARVIGLEQTKRAVSLRALE